MLTVRCVLGSTSYEMGLPTVSGTISRTGVSVLDLVRVYDIPAPQGRALYVRGLPDHLRGSSCVCVPSARVAAHARASTFG